MSKQLYEMTTVTAEDMRKDMSDYEIRGIRSYIDEFHEELNLPSVDAMGGLYYTSSSQYALLGIQGKGEIEIGSEHVASHFTLTNNGILILVAYDDDGNETYFHID